MSIYFNGDIHGTLEVERVVKFFSKKHDLSKDDYLILLGDVGVCWDNGRRDQEVIAALKSLPVTTLFIDGNHENFDLLNDYPVTEWNGGCVHIIEEDIIHLMRGYIFTIDGTTIFTFGGATSTDRASRIEGISWFKEELPTSKECERGYRNLEKHNYKVDYIITHTAPYNVAAYLNEDIWDEERDFQYYLQNIADSTIFKKWLFGHFHIDQKIGKKYLAVYDAFWKVK